MDDIGRRRLLGAAATTGTAGAAGLGAGSAGAQSGDATDRRGEETVTVVVGPDGEFVFEPARVWVDPGTTVEFVWESDNHNVVVEDSPAESDWLGTPNAPRETYDAGYEFGHTFDVEGTYEYYCDPHRGAGMVGTVLVGDDAGSGGGNEGLRPLLGMILLTFVAGAVGGYLLVNRGGDGDGDAAESSDS